VYSTLLGTELLTSHDVWITSSFLKNHHLLFNYYESWNFSYQLYTEEWSLLHAYLLIARNEWIIIIIIIIITIIIIIVIIIIIIIVKVIVVEFPEWGKFYIGETGKSMLEKLKNTTGNTARL